MKCKDCYKEGCSQRAYTDDAECVLQQWTAKQFDWQSFRAEATKDILCAMIGEVMKVKDGSEFIDKTVCSAIVIADNLISKLKEKGKK